MELWILFGVFTLLMLIGTPIAFCLGVASFATVLYMGLPPLVVFQRLNSGMSVFSLLAIPFFIYAGDLMVRGGIAQTDRRLRRLRWSVTSAAASDRSTSSPRRCSAAFPARPSPRPPPSAG